MSLEEGELTVVLLACNTLFKITTGLTTSSPTGYNIRPECRIFGGKVIPTNVTTLLTEQGLPAQNRYTKTEHLTRLLRLIKTYQQFTKSQEGYCAVAMHLDNLPTLKTHNDVITALEVLDDDPF